MKHYWRTFYVLRGAEKVLDYELTISNAGVHGWLWTNNNEWEFRYWRLDFTEFVKISLREKITKRQAMKRCVEILETEVNCKRKLDRIDND